MAVAGFGIAFWRLPKIATGVAASFLVVITTLRDFWNADEDDRSGKRLA